MDGLILYPFPDGAWIRIFGDETEQRLLSWRKTILRLVRPIARSTILRKTWAAIPFLASGPRRRQVDKLFLVLSPFVGRFFKEGNEEILLVDLSGHDRLPPGSLSVCISIKGLDHRSVAGAAGRTRASALEGDIAHDPSRHAQHPPDPYLFHGVGISAQ